MGIMHRRKTVGNFRRLRAYTKKDAFNSIRDFLVFLKFYADNASMSVNRDASAI